MSFKKDSEVYPSHHIKLLLLRDFQRYKNLLIQIIDERDNENRFPA